MRRSWLLGAAMCCVLAAASPDAVAQQLLQGLQGRTPEPLLERSAPTENLFRTAEDGITRKDWKLAIDSLQRIIDSPRAGLVEAEEAPLAPLVAGDDPVSHRGEQLRYFESSRRKAERMLASMPAEGLSAYRLLNDGRAEGLYTAAVEEGDFEALRDLVNRFLLTSVGDDAAALLAAWYLDIGEAAFALELLDRIDECVESPSTPSWRLQLQRAIALRQLGDDAGAVQAYEAARSAAGTTGSAAASVAAYASFLDISSDSDATVGGHGRPSESWPDWGGGPRRQGLMTGVAPALQQLLPWAESLPQDEPDWWERFCVESDKSNRRPSAKLPALQPIMADGRVFVQCDGQVAAFDQESLRRAWVSYESVKTPEAASIDFTGFRQPRLTFDVDTLGPDERVLYDYVSGTISAGAGLVYAIDFDGVGGAATPAESLALLQQRGSAVLRGNRLLARHAENGRVAWERGRTGDSQDSLGNVFFAAPPLLVDGRLWTPFVREGDVYLGVLDPADGRLLDSTLVCSIDEGHLRQRRFEAMAPASDTRLVYVSTSLGVVAAIGADSVGLQWAMEYPRDEIASRRDVPTPAGWACDPPVVAGGLLLAAPMDSPYLFALDAATGRARWLRERMAHTSYILAADDQRVWLGGENVCCLRLDDGSVVWGESPDTLYDATGRAVLSGDRIYLPTLDGLVTLDAATGEHLETMSLPADQLPLGNLLCAGGAMFSVDPNLIRKYADLEQSYPRQLARLEANPADAQAALCVAWLEMQRGRPDRAREVLANLREQGGAPPRLQDEVDGLQVRALLELARDPSLDDEPVVEILRQAASLARTSDDRFRASLELASRLRKVGSAEEAYLIAWRVGGAEAADRTVTVAPRLRNDCRLIVRNLLHRWGRDLTAQQLRTVADESLEAVRQAADDLSNPPTRDEAADRLKRLAALEDVAGAAQLAAIHLGDYARGEQAFEQAEQWYRHALRGGAVSRYRGMALARLAELYLAPEQDFPDQAASMIDELATLGDVGIPWPASGDSASEASAADVAKELRSRVDAEQASMLAVLRHPERLRLVEGGQERQLMIASYDRPRMFDYDGGLPSAVRDQIHVAPTPDSVLAMGRESGRSDWTTTLRLLGRVAIEDDDPAEWNIDAGSPRVVADGQTGIMNAASGLFAMGLKTGRRLWGLPLDRSTADMARTLPQSVSLRNRLFDVQDGVLVYVPRPRSVVATPIHDNERVLWDCVLTGDAIDTVVIRDDVVLVLDASRELARSLALEDGASLAEMRFVQEDPVEAVSLVYVDGCLAGPGDHTLVGYDVRTGDRTWSVDIDEEIRSLFKPGEGLVGAACFGGRVLLVDALTGDVVFDRQLEAAGEGLADGVLHGELLIVMGIDPAPRGDVPTLVGIERDTGRQRWIRNDFDAAGPNRFGLWRNLHMVDDVIPMFKIVRDENDADGFRRRFGRLAACVVEKETGADYGPVVETHRTRNQQMATGVGRIWLGWWVTEVGDGLTSFPIVLESSAVASKPAAAVEASGE